jgi:hypothetical protein
MHTYSKRRGNPGVRGCNRLPTKHRTLPMAGRFPWVCIAKGPQQHGSNDPTDTAL